MQPTIVSRLPGRIAVLTCVEILRAFASPVSSIEMFSIMVRMTAFWLALLGCVLRLLLSRLLAVTFVHRLHFVIRPRLAGPARQAIREAGHKLLLMLFGQSGQLRDKCNDAPDRRVVIIKPPAGMPLILTPC